MENTITSTITPETWEARISALPLEKPVVRAAARIVWWDFFSQRENKERWNNLDRWLGYDPSEVDTSTLQSALVRVGYSPTEAKKRAREFTE